MQNKDKGDGIEDSLLDMLLVILLEGASKEVVTPSSQMENHNIIENHVMHQTKTITKRHLAGSPSPPGGS